MSLHGKSALVTGSTSGIGLAIARGFAASGCSLVITGLGDPTQNHALARDLAGQHGIQAAYVPANAASPVEIRGLVAASNARFGAIDILVNNAGIQHVAPVDEFPDEQWDRVLAINLSAAFHATKAILPSMKVKHWGRVINIASVHGLVASVGKAAYVAAKHGLVGLTKVIALENAQLGITANAICPGWVRTPLVDQQVQARAAHTGRTLADEEKLLLGEKQPLQAFTTPEQIAALAVFLCGDGASTITGASLSIDGGWIAQ